MTKRKEVALIVGLVGAAVLVYFLTKPRTSALVAPGGIVGSAPGGINWASIASTFGSLLGTTTPTTTTETTQQITLDQIGSG